MVVFLVDIAWTTNPIVTFVPLGWEKYDDVQSGQLLRSDVASNEANEDTHVSHRVVVVKLSSCKAHGNAKRVDIRQMVSRQMTHS